MSDEIRGSPPPGVEHNDAGPNQAQEDAAGEAWQAALADTADTTDKPEDAGPKPDDPPPGPTPSPPPSNVLYFADSFIPLGRK